ncbi:MAG: thioredoxin family protein [Dehalococcoidia bacterium]|nr:thioredoxin family protein [Dehalococcoidia bacterium]
MKLIIFIIFSVFFISCENQEINTLELKSENKENAISNNERNLIRTFDDDYALWVAEDNSEIYEDLSEKLGFFSSFEELRQTQYRSKGIITDLTSVQSIVNSGKPTFLEGWSETCVYCKMGEVILGDLKSDYKNDINFVTVDVANRYLEDVSDTLSYFDIFSTPTYIFFDKNGREIYRSVGYSAQKKELMEIFEQAIIE